MTTFSQWPHFLRWAVAGILTLALSCTDHQIETNLPESACKATDGTDRLYPCEFIIERISFLGKTGDVLGAVTASMQSVTLSRFEAGSNTYAGSTAGMSGAATFDVRLTLKRVASPSFPVNEGYLIGFTRNSAGRMILHTPSGPGDTYGERTRLGAPVALDMPIGGSRDVTVQLTVPYAMVDAGASGIVPVPFTSATTFFVDNDVTTLQFDRTTSPYRFVGSVVEAYYEKVSVNLRN